MDIACPICYDHYNDKDKIPHILQCGHTFCQNCLMDLRTSNILTCPTCRKYFAPDVKQLIKNFTILGKRITKIKRCVQTTFTNTRIRSSNKSALMRLSLRSSASSIHRRRLSTSVRTTSSMCAQGA